MRKVLDVTNPQNNKKKTKTVLKEGSLVRLLRDMDMGLWREKGSINGMDLIGSFKGILAF